MLALNFCRDEYTKPIDYVIGTSRDSLFGSPLRARRFALCRMCFSSLKTHQHFSISHSLLERLPGYHTVMPCLDIGEVLQRLQIWDAKGRVRIHPIIPSDERQVRESALVPDKPVLLVETVVQHSKDPLNFVIVYCMGRRKFPGVE